MGVVAATLGAAALTGGAGYLSSRENRKAQEKAYDPQRQLMETFLPHYKELAPMVTEAIKGKIGAKGLPEDVSQAITKYYGKAGRGLGEYFAGKGTLRSGRADMGYEDLLKGEAGQRTTALLGERRSGIQDALSFMRQQPSQPGVSPQQEQIDWGSLGGLFAQGFQQTPTATTMPYQNQYASDPYGGNQVASMGGNQATSFNITPGLYGGPGWLE